MSYIAYACDKGCCDVAVSRNGWKQGRLIAWTVNYNGEPLTFGQLANRLGRSKHCVRERVKGRHCLHGGAHGGKRTKGERRIERVRAAELEKIAAAQKQDDAQLLARFLRLPRPPIRIVES